MFLVDTNVFLEVMLGRPKRASCIAFLEQLRQGKISGAVTDFTIYSVLLILEHAKKLDQAKMFLSTLAAYKGLSVHVLSLEDKLASLDLAIARKFDLDDAFQYASAVKLGTEGIVSLDKHFEKRQIPRLEPAAIALVDNCF